MARLSARERRETEIEEGVSHKSLKRVGMTRVFYKLKRNKTGMFFYIPNIRYWI